MTVKIAAIGLAHNHLYGMVDALVAAGAVLTHFHDHDPAAVQALTVRYPQAQLAASEQAILDDESVDVIVSAAIPDRRARLGILAMQHGKDFLCAKPGFVALHQLAEVRRVQAETGRQYKVYFGERFHNMATVKAGELVHQGAIGRVVQTVGFGPHRLLGHVPRPDWSFERSAFGGVINDLASHQMDQFLYFTGSTSAQVVAANVGNFKHTAYPNMHDFGDVMVRSDGAVGYVRVDWLTPEGLATWGDVRLFILGTAGTIEIRKNIDLNGRAGGNHLFMVDQTGTHYIECDAVELPFGRQFLDDVHNRTETAMSQAHCFLASELALAAESLAVELR